MYHMLYTGNSYRLKSSKFFFNSYASRCYAATHSCVLHMFSCCIFYYYFNALSSFYATPEFTSPDCNHWPASSLSLSPVPSLTIRTHTHPFFDILMHPPGPKQLHEKIFSKPPLFAGACSPMRFSF